MVEEEEMGGASSESPDVRGLAAPELGSSARSGGIQVLLKAMGVLDLLEQQADLTPAEIARALDEPRSSIYRILATLESLDLIERTHRRGRYRLGMKLFRLGNAAIHRLDLRDAARPVMEELHDLTLETVFLMVEHRCEAVCIDRIDGQWVQSMALRVGTSLPLHIGAGPRVLLAFEPPDRRETYMSQALEAYTSHSPVDRNQLSAMLDAVQATGVSISDQDVVEGMAAIGAPIRGRDGTVSAAISLSGPAPTILGRNRIKNSELVVDAAAKISHGFGYRAVTLPASQPL